MANELPAAEQVNPGRRGDIVRNTMSGAPRSKPTLAGIFGGFLNSSSRAETEDPRLVNYKIRLGGKKLAGVSDPAGEVEWSDGPKCRNEDTSEIGKPNLRRGPTPEEHLEVCSAIVTIYRHFGSRTNRKLAL